MLLSLVVPNTSSSWSFHLFRTQGLLRTTLPHPKAERCYAQYEITQLLPGIELFSDRYRADICSVIASLYYVIRELHFAKQNLVVSDLQNQQILIHLIHPTYIVIHPTYIVIFIWQG